MEQHYQAPDQFLLSVRNIDLPRQEMFFDYLYELDNIHVPVPHIELVLKDIDSERVEVQCEV